MSSKERSLVIVCLEMGGEGNRRGDGGKCPGEVAADASHNQSCLVTAAAAAAALPLALPGSPASPSLPTITICPFPHRKLV